MCLTINIYRKQVKAAREIREENENLVYEFCEIV